MAAEPSTPRHAGGLATTGGGPMASRSSTGLRGASTDVAALIRLRHRAELMTLFRRKAQAAQSGSQSSRFRGRGIDFDEVRLYHTGDDVRAIDWRVTARTGQAHTKLFREERERPVLLAVDQRPTMAFGSRQRFKSVTAAEAAALCAWAALAAGNRVGGLVFDVNGPGKSLRPKRSQRAMLSLLGQTAAGTQALLARSRDQTVAAPNSSGLSDALSQLHRIAHPGTIAVVISDFIGLDQTAEQALGLLAKHCEVLCVSIFDALEAELPPPAIYSLSDGVQSGSLNAGDANTRMDHRARFNQRQQHLVDLCNRMRVRVAAIGGQDDCAQLLDGAGARARSR